ncbi:hypothetical protein H6F51_16245 [Cyanobacteria bacterium FACHB-DQ100]|nr:hypothetical protein [Cyanobacteria bacterium FACHB-DQ100]
MNSEPAIVIGAIAAWLLLALYRRLVFRIRLYFALGLYLSLIKTERLNPGRLTRDDNSTDRKRITSMEDIISFPLLTSGSD